MFQNNSQKNEFMFQVHTRIKTSYKNRDTANVSIRKTSQFEYKAFCLFSHTWKLKRSPSRFFLFCLEHEGKVFKICMVGWTKMAAECLVGFFRAIRFQFFQSISDLKCRTPIFLLCMDDPVYKMVHWKEGKHNTIISAFWIYNEKKKTVSISNSRFEIFSGCQKVEFHFKRQHADHVNKVSDSNLVSWSKVVKGLIRSWSCDQGVKW